MDSAIIEWVKGALEDQTPRELITQLDDKFEKLVNSINTSIQSIEYDKRELDDLNKLADELQSELSTLQRDLKDLSSSKVNLSKLEELSTLHSELLNQTEKLRNSFI